MTLPKGMLPTSISGMRDQQIGYLQHFIADAETRLAAQAETVSMSLPQLRGYVQLVGVGLPYESVGSLLRRVPDDKVDACVAQLTKAHQRGTKTTC